MTSVASRSELLIRGKSLSICRVHGHSFDQQWFAIAKLGSYKNIAYKTARVMSV